MKLCLPILIALSLGFAPAAPGDGAPVFSAPLTIDNTWMPFQPGAVKVYGGRSDGAAEVVADIYLTETRVIDVGGTPVECAILQETEFEDGVIAEISRNYFAQADDGSVYYFGELVDSYEDGQVTGHEGSWLVGGPTDPTDPEETATATEPALFMPAAPAVGDSWKPEDLFPIVDETVTLLDDSATTKVPAGKFEDCLKVQETTQLSSETELKWYAPGVGVVRTKAKGESLRLLASTLVPPEEP